MRYSNLKLTGAAMALLMTTATGALADGSKSVGTMAGTTIENTVSVTFSRGSAEVSTTASATFHVDRKIDMIMDTPHETAVALDLGEGTFTQTLDFNFTNYSNAEVDFTISVDAPAGFSEAAEGDDTYQVFVDGALILNDGTITVAANAAPEIEVRARFAPDSDDVTRTFTVTAAPTGAFDEATGRDITLAGADNMNTLHLFVAADQTASASVDLTSPLLTASKSVAVISDDADFNCASGEAAGGSQAAIPGACIEYTITVNNTGGAAMRNLSVSDTMPANVTLVGAYSDDEFFNVSTNGAEVTAEATGSLTSNTSRVLRIRATID